MRPIRVLALLLALASVAGAATAGEQSFRVKSRALANVYVDGGRAAGLKVGARLNVMADGKTVAELEVVSIADKWASCRIVSQSRPIAIGSKVVPASTTGPVAEARSKPAPTPPPMPTPALTPPAEPGPSPAPVAKPIPVPAREAGPPAKPAATPDPAPRRPFAAMPVALAGPPPASGRRFSVKYRSASNVYLNAGRAAGLDVGDRLNVVAGQSIVAELEVVYAAEQSASCKVVSETRPVQAGDEVVAVARASRPEQQAAVVPAAGATTVSRVAPATPAQAPPAPASATPSTGAPWGRVRGGASLGYYRVWDRTESALDFQERTGRLDLAVYDIAGQPLSFTVRGRSRKDVRARTLSERTPIEERTDRVYELALRYEPPSDRFGLEVGRIGIYRFVGIGYLDGFLGRFRPRPSLQVGAFGGRVADIESFGLDGTGSKYGGFVRLEPGGRYSPGPYDVMLAFVRENADGDVSRQYLSLESRLGKGSRWSLFQRAELDLNTGWRKDLTGKSYQFSNVSFSGNLRVASSAWAFVSYDGLRNYRYYRNRLVPEEVFDDLLHQGLRAGFNVARPGGFGATAGFGMSLKEPDPRHPELDIANAYSFNAGVRHANLFSSGFSAGIDGTGFTNGYTEGGLVSVRLGRRFAAGHFVDLSYGRTFYRLKLTEQDRATQWLRLVGRLELGHRVYVQGDFEYDAGDDLEGPRGFLELGILF